LGTKLNKLIIKFLKEIYFFCYLYVKKTSRIITFIYEFNCRVFNKTELTLNKFSKKAWEFFLVLHYYFFFLKKHLYDKGFCVVLYFVWRNFGFQWYFYNVLNHYFWNLQIAVWWVFMPNHIQERIIFNYYRFRFYLWRLRRKKRISQKKLTLFIRKFFFIYEKKKQNILKFCFYVFIFTFTIYSFIEFSFAKLLFKWFFLFEKRIVFFIISSVKYFVLFLKFKCYFFFLEHVRKFNLHMKYAESRVKSRSYLIDDRFCGVNNFYYTVFNFFVNSIKKTKNIFYYYKFRKDLSFYGFGERKKLHETNFYYSFIFYKLKKKKYKKYKAQKFVFCLKILWLYRINYNFFFFY